jgi:integrase
MGSAKMWDQANAFTFEKLSESLGLKMPAKFLPQSGPKFSDPKNENDEAGHGSSAFLSLSLLHPGGQPQRYFTPDELARLKNAVETSHNPSLKHIVALVVLTGERLQDLLAARWDDIDFEASLWTILSPDSGKTRHVQLSTAAVDVFNNLPRWDDCPYAIANPRTKKPYHSFFGSWDAARKKAGLTDISIHDLRNSGTRNW